MVTPSLKSNVGDQKVCKKNNLSWLFGADRKICPSDHSLASLSTTSLCQTVTLGQIFLFAPHTHERLLYSCIPDKVFHHFTWYKTFQSYTTLCKMRNPDSVMWLTDIGPRWVKKYSLCATFTVTLRRVHILANQGILCLLKWRTIFLGRPLDS